MHRPLAPGAPQVLVLGGVAAALLAHLAVTHQRQVPRHPVVNERGGGRRNGGLVPDAPRDVLAFDLLRGAPQTSSAEARGEATVAAQVARHSGGGRGGRGSPHRASSHLSGFGAPNEDAAADGAVEGEE